jgi:Flp pilus assembly protein TadG
MLRVVKDAVRDQAGGTMLMFALSAPVLFGVTLIGVSYSMQITTSNSK